jgi:hypothetical protein
MDLGTLFGEEPEVEAIGEIDEFEEALDFEAELEEPLFDAEEEAVERPRRRPVLRTLLVMLVVLVAALALVVLIAVSRPTAPAPATQPTSVPTLVVSDTVQVALDAAQQTANQQSQLLGGPATARLETSSLGTTLMIRVCRPAGTDLSQAMMIAMEMAANSGVSVRNELDAVGADLVNCDRDDTLMSAVAPVEQAMAFAADRSISSDEFRAGWQWQP